MSLLEKFTSLLPNRLKAIFQDFYKKILPFIELTRLNRPIGIYLLLWPTIAGLWIASAGSPTPSLVTIFILGTVVMRSAGCCINDFADYQVDGTVERTKNRPLVNGRLKRSDALFCFSLFSSIGFILVLFTNSETIFLSFGAIAVITVYPFAKRYTNLPQLILGVAFSWGILMTFTATKGNITQIAFLLFVANILWTIAYDTQYAMVDREFDIKIGVKSTAILFGDSDRIVIGLLHTGFIATLFLVALQLQFGLVYYISLGIASLLLSYQHYLIKDRQPDLCFRAFLNNNWVGLVIFLGTLLHYL